MIALDWELLKHKYLIEKKSLRRICRELHIDVNNRIRMATFLRDNGFPIRRGRISKNPTAMVGMKIPITCPECGKERIGIVNKSGESKRLCYSCATRKSHKDNPRIGRAENHYNWKGGLNVTDDGYILEYVKKSNPFFPMAANCHRAGGYILQHRLVMARHLERMLRPSEIVHHINGDRKDNHIENLKLTIRQEHSLSYKTAYLDGYAQAMKDNGKSWNAEKKEWEK